MKTWKLIAPSWADLDGIWRNPRPFALWPICAKEMIAHWLDDAVAKDVQTIVIISPDRPHLIRQWLLRGNLWTREIQILTDDTEVPNSETFTMDRLPDQEALPEPRTAQELMKRWFSLQVDSIEARKTMAQQIDFELREGVWLGPGAEVHPSCTLEAPCWIGSGAKIGAGSRIGPGGFVGHRSFLDEDVEVVGGIVCQDTYVGRHTSLRDAAVQGGLLMDWKRGVRIELADHLLLRELDDDKGRPGWVERLVSLLIWLILSPVAFLLNLGQQRAVRVVRITNQPVVTLKTWPQGPLVIRRVQWFFKVAAGRMRVVGVLPRSVEEWEALFPEIRAAIERAPTGIFALSDLHDCHDPSSSDEWIHAGFQAGAPDGAGDRQARRGLLKIAFKVPAAE